MLTVDTLGMKFSGEDCRSRSEGLLFSINGYGAFKARKPVGSAEHHGLSRSCSLSSVSFLRNRVTAVATGPAVPAAVTTAPAVPAAVTTGPAVPAGALSAVPAPPIVITTSTDTTINTTITSEDDFETATEIAEAKMPKKTAANDRKGSTRLFRSVSMGTRKQNKADAAGKDCRKDDDKRTSSTCISDSDKVDVLVEHNTLIMEDKYDALEEGTKIRTQLQQANAKLHDAEQEVENLKALLSSSYKAENGRSLDGIDLGLSEASGVSGLAEREQSRTIIYPSKVEHHETTIEASGYPIQHSQVSCCRECERLKQTKIKALVEAIALRKYVRQLSEALSGDDQTKQNVLNELEKKLISEQTEKEIALEELAHVIEQRDQVICERDRALEEWGKAATKWESTLDQVDSLMKELNKVKSSRDELLLQIERSEDLMKMEIESREKLLDELTMLNEQLNCTKKERRHTIMEYDVASKDKLEKEQQLQKASTELAKAQQRCLELDAKLTSITEKSDSYKKERDHAKEQWRHSVKERKKLHREMAATVHARDEAIQKCFSTAEQLDKLKEDYNRLLNRLARTGITSGSESSTCSLKDCQFCSDPDSSASMEDLHRLEGKEIKVSLDKDDPLDSIKICKAAYRGRSFTAVIEVEKALGAAKNVKKYDEIVSINDIPVSENDQNLVRSLLDGATSTINMVIRRPTSNYQMTFDVDLKIPKKSKTGLGFECGLYVKDIAFGGVASEQKTLEIGDYILKINGKHLDKIIASSIEKVIKKSGDKMKFHITRTIQTSTRHDHKSDPRDDVILRRLPGARSRVSVDDSNRLSLISNDSSISMRSRDSRLSGASSLGSMASYTDSCFADSSSDHSGHVLHSTPVFHAERPRIATAVYIPQLEMSSEGGTTEDERQSSEHPTSDTKESDGDLTSTKSSGFGRKFVSTSMLRCNSGEFGSGYGLTRTQSTITAIRIDEDAFDTVLKRPGMVETLTATGERARVIRLEKKPFKSLGVEVVGGNLVGIYVKELTEDSVCKAVGLQTGDRIFKLNCYDLTRATLDHATRIVRLLSSCTYIRIEAQARPNYEEVLKDSPHDSVYVRTVHPYKAMSPDELSFTVGETLHVINTRANYDQAKQSWKWVAMRARKDGRNVDEGLVPSMGSLPEHVESSIISQITPKIESESEDCLSDDGNAALKRGGSERKSFLQRYRKIRKRDNKDHHVSSADENGNCSKIIYYEILSKIS